MYVIFKNFSDAAAFVSSSAVKMATILKMAARNCDFVFISPN